LKVNPLPEKSTHRHGHIELESMSTPNLRKTYPLIILTHTLKSYPVYMCVLSLLGIEAAAVAAGFVGR
jgi:hypothetical protein